MSLTEDIEVLKGQLAELSGLCESKDQEIAAKDQEIADIAEAAQVRSEEVAQELAQKDEIIQEQTDAITGHEQARDVLSEQVVTLQTELDQAKTALAQPAFVDAAGDGEDHAVEANAEAGEPEAEEKSLLDQFVALEGGERTAFYKENEAELIREMKGV